MLRPTSRNLHRACFRFPYPAMTSRHYLTRSNDAHWYVVPAERGEEWEEWLALDTDDQRSWEAPVRARCVDSPSTVSFAEWTEDV